MLASLTIVSFDPGRPIDAETLDDRAVDRRAGGARDRQRRLYQQQKEFADTMQRSLLPRSHPALEGLEIGEVYESSARVDVGGDVYDFLELADGRLAVVLGDVTGHGIEATADMAMAKFVFRSLAREHPEPGDFLAVGERRRRRRDRSRASSSRWSYLTIDPRTGEVVARGRRSSGAAARLRRRTGDAAGGRRARARRRAGQEYDEDARAARAGRRGRLYTDGVIEARRDGELYGDERLDDVLAAARGAAARARSREAVSTTAARSPAASSPTTARSSSIKRDTP